MSDPFLSYFGHPKLPTGYNSYDINGDDLDGPGVNEPVWPHWFDSFVPCEILIVTEEMIDVFEEQCPDLVVPHDSWELLFPIGEQPLELKGPWPTLMIAGVSNTLQIKPVDDVFLVPDRTPTLDISAVRQRQLISRETDTVSAARRRK